LVRALLSIRDILLLLKAAVVASLTPSSLLNMLVGRNPIEKSLILRKMTSMTFQLSKIRRVKAGSWMRKALIKSYF
jgi:hypothetical protein